MKFGLFYNLRFPEPWSSDREYEFPWQVLEQITYAEEMGFEGLWLTEHHFEWGLVASAPEVGQHSAQLHAAISRFPGTS